MTSSRLAIVQPYVSDYRINFFRGLIDRLARSDIECIVIAGHARGSQAFRDQGHTINDALKRADPRSMNIGGHELSFYGTDRLWRECSGVIMQLRGLSIDLTTELARKRWSRRRVGVWGHVTPSVKPPNAVDLAIERWQMRHSDHVFAYTESGAELALSAGVDPSKVTPVMNSIDVTDFVSAYTSVTPELLGSFQHKHNLPPGKTFGYVGRLDAEKRVDFLAEALDILWKIDPTVKLLVGGRGNQEALLHPAAERGQVVLLGFVDVSIMALMARASEAFVNPGHIGLLAVECLAVSLPIITVEHGMQSPEYEYLELDTDVFLSQDTPAAFANRMAMPPNRDAIALKCNPRPYPTLEDMIQNYARGVERMMN